MNFLERQIALKLDLIDDDQAILKCNVRLGAMFRAFASFVGFIIASGLGILFFILIPKDSTKGLLAVSALVLLGIFFLIMGITNFTDKEFLIANKTTNIMEFKKRKYGLFMREIAKLDLDKVNKITTKKTQRTIDVSSSEDTYQDLRTINVYLILVNTSDGEEIETVVFPHARKPTKTIKAFNLWLKDKTLDKKRFRDAP